MVTLNWRNHLKKLFYTLRWMNVCISGSIVVKVKMKCLREREREKLKKQTKQKSSFLTVVGFYVICQIWYRVGCKSFHFAKIYLIRYYNIFSIRKGNVTNWFPFPLLPNLANTLAVNTWSVVLSLKLIIILHFQIPHITYQQVIAKMTYR